MPLAEAPGSSSIPPGRIAAVIVLAAGEGTRMRSTIPKVLHRIAGRPLLWHALRAAQGMSPQQLIVVVGHGRNQVSAFLQGDADFAAVRAAVQDRQLGTGHAVQCAIEVTGPLTGTVIVTYGDVPLLRTETLAALATQHEEQGNAVTVLTAEPADPTGYGRILRAPDGSVAGIVEQKDADPEQRAIREVNSGVYAFDGTLLEGALGRLRTDNLAGERYLTDVVGIARGDGHRVGAMQSADAAETEGVNDRVQLADLARRLNAQLVRKAQLTGVTVHDPATTWIHADVTIGADTEVHPGTQLRTGTVVGEGCVIGPDTTLSECVVGDGASVIRSHCTGARIGPRASVGPFTFLRPAAELQEDAKAGAFVEIKHSTIGPGAKVPHLSYVGDATIGAGANIGAGTITANYDGEHKYPTTIGAHAFVGTNTTLIAPVTIADGAYVAAGSAITSDVAPGDLAVARERQRAVRGWVARKRPGSASARAADAATAGADEDSTATVVTDEAAIGLNAGSGLADTSQHLLAPSIQGDQPA